MPAEEAVELARTGAGRCGLDAISRYFPEYADTMKARLGAEGP